MAEAVKVKCRNSEKKRTVGKSRLEDQNLDLHLPSPPTDEPCDLNVKVQVQDDAISIPECEKEFIQNKAPDLCSEIANEIQKGNKSTIPDCKSHFALSESDNAESEFSAASPSCPPEELIDFKHSQPIFIKNELLWEDFSSNKLCKELPGTISKTKESIVCYPHLTKVKKDLSCLRPVIQQHFDCMKRKCHQKATLSFDDFVQAQKNLRSHPLYDLLNMYMKSRADVTSVKFEFAELNEKYNNKKVMLWHTNPKIVTGKGRCSDGNYVEVSHQYVEGSLNENVHKEVEQLLLQKQKLIQSYIGNTYLAHMSKVRVELYIYNLSSDIQKTLSNITEMPEVHKKELKSCISILFSFQRIEVKDKDFVKDTRHWLTRLVLILLKSTSFSDHLFILNHVIRCPKNIESWATCYVQLPVPNLQDAFPSDLTIESSFLDHCLTVLKIILSPIPKKEEYLKQLIVSAKNNSLPVETTSNEWLLIDSDGEENENTIEYYLHFKEKDIISLLNQTPLSSIFCYVLNIHKEKENLKYDVSKTTHQQIEHLFAFSSFLLDLCFEGMTTFDSRKYPEMSKRIGELMKDTIQFVSMHWNNFKMHNNCDEDTKECLQCEFDEFFLYGVKKLLFVPDLAALSYMVDLPYSYISDEITWKLYWLFHAFGFEIDHPKFEEIESKLQDIEIKALLQQRISELPLTNASCLLRILASLAQNCSNDDVFVKAVVCRILEVAFINEDAKEGIYKECKNCVIYISEKHPVIISLVLKKMNENIEILNEEKLLYLFKEFPLLSWIPNCNDFEVLNAWLCADLNSSCNKCARVIISNMNWNLNVDGSYALSIQQHQEVAIMIVQALEKFAISSDYKTLVLKGIQRCQELTNLLKKEDPETSSRDEAFKTWAWKLLFSLRLHSLDYNHPPWPEVLTGIFRNRNIPELHNDPKLEPLRQGIKRKQPCAIYVALIMTSVGHNCQNMLKDGLPLFTELVQQGEYAAAIRVLFYIVPFFSQNPETLCFNTSFLTTLKQIVSADLTWKSIETLKAMTIGTSESFIGQVIKQLSSMIIFQVQLAGKMAREFSSKLIKLWIHILFKVLENPENSKEKINSELQACYLLDQIFKFASLDIYTLSEVLELVNCLVETKVTSVVHQCDSSSYFNILKLRKSKKTLPSLIPQNCLASFSWFIWCILISENRLRSNEKAIKQLLQKLAVENTLTPEMAIKAMSSVDAIVPPVDYLTIYRWANQIIMSQTSHPHEVLPLLWQHFFLFFFRRVPSEHGLPVKGSLGYKFFASGDKKKLMEQLKKSLSENADYYFRQNERLASELNRLNDSNGSAINGRKKSFDEAKYIMEFDMEHNRKLQLLYNTFSNWLTEPKLHDPTVHLLSLPPHFQSDLLEKIFNQEQKLWMEYINIRQVKSSIDEFVLHYWQSFKSPETKQTKSQANISCDDIILCHLKNYKLPKGSPAVTDYNCPVIQIQPEKYLNLSFQNFLNLDMKIFFQHAQTYHDWMTSLMKLDESYVELIPGHYSNIEKEIIKKRTCKKAVNKERSGCSGAAEFRLVFKEFTENITAKGHIDNNRSNYCILENKLIESFSKDLCSAGINTENNLKSLVDYSKMSGYEYLSAHGKEIFYNILQTCDEAVGSSKVQEYPPFKEYLNSNLDILGTTLIEGDEDQLEQLLISAIEYSSVGFIVAKYFKPSYASAEIYLRLYGLLVQKMSDPLVADILFSFLSKFEFSKWIETKGKRILLSQRDILMKSIGQALFHCGQSPKEKMQDLHEAFRSHLKKFTEVNVQDHYGLVLKLLLEGMESSNISLAVWNDFFHSLGCIIIENSIALLKRSFRKYANKQNQLSEENIEEVMEYLGNYFHKKRLISPSTMEHGLYYEYEYYLYQIGFFYGMIGHAFVKSYSLDRNKDATTVVWKKLHHFFQPWIEPKENGDSLLFPWLPGEEDKATLMLQIFILCIEYYYDQHREAPYSSILSCVWRYYADTYGLEGIRHYSINVVLTVFKELPWHEFYPSYQDVRLMNKVINAGISESTFFLGHICERIPWVAAINRLKETKPSEANLFMESLGVLLIKVAWEPTVIKNNLLFEKMPSLYGLPWDALNDSSVEEIVDSYSEFCNPICLLDKENNFLPDVYILEFLKSICCFGMMSLNTEKPELLRRQILFVNKYIQLLGRCTSTNLSLTKSQTEVFNDCIINLLNEIEALVVKESTSEKQLNKAVVLVHEVLALLNITMNPELAKSELHVITKWLENNPRSILLLPLLHKSCCSVASMNQVVLIVECCVSANYDKGCKESMLTVNWLKLVVQYLEIPELFLEEFMHSCITTGSFFTLYIFVLKRQLGFHSEQDQLLMLSDLVNLKLITPFENKAEHSEFLEAKLLLLWDKMLDMCQLLCTSEHLTDLTSIMNKFCAILSTFSKVDSSMSFIRKLLYKNSTQVSVKFQFLCQALEVYLQLQMSESGTIRSSKSSPGKTQENKRFLLACSHLKSMQNNKSYAALKSNIESALKFIENTEHCLLHSRQFLKELSSGLYQFSFLQVLNTPDHHDNTSDT